MVNVYPLFGFPFGPTYISTISCLLLQFREARGEPFIALFWF
jgi:hypothetical protein